METRVNEAQLTDTTLVHKHDQQTLKVKHKSKGRKNANIDNMLMCYQRGN